MKKSFLTIICILVAMLIFYTAINTIVKISIEKKVKADIGLQLKIGSFNISPVRSLVEIKDFRLFNPEGYQDRIILDIPKISIDYDPLVVLKGKIHIEQVIIYLKELTVVKNEHGKVNLAYLEAAQKQQKSKRVDPSKIKIDRLKIKIGKVIYKDYSKNIPKVRKFNIDNEASCEEILDPDKVFEFVIASALMQSDIGYLADFDLIPLINDMHASCKKPTILATKIINKTVEFSKDLCNATKHSFKVNMEKIKNYFSPKEKKLATNP